MAEPDPNPDPLDPPALTGPTLDHLALASHHIWDNLIRYCHHLGARWLGGLPEDAVAPFDFAHVELAGGTKLEFLQPRSGAGSDFLRRFLDRNGPGPHHLTFKVPDIAVAMAQATAAGYDIVNEQLDSPTWKEAFLHPKQSHGIVIQLAQPGGESGWDEPRPLPPGLQQGPPTLTELVHLVADLDAATKLFSGALGMTIVQRGTDNRGDFTLLGHGPWNLRLVDPVLDRHQQWLADRPGRLLHLSMAVDDVATVPDLAPADGVAWELRPEVNQGTRLLLTSRHS